MSGIPKNSKRPVIYFVVGVGNTVLDFAFYTLLRLTVLPDKNDIALAGIISGAFAMICAFTAHGLITWRGAHLSRKTVLKFFVLTGFGLWVIRPALLSIFINFDWLYDGTYSVSHALHLPFTLNFIANTGAFGLMAAILLFYNYYMYGHYVFKKKGDKLLP